MIEAAEIVLLQAKSRRTVISRLVENLTEDKSLHYKIKENISRMEDIFPSYLGKGVVILRSSGILKDLRVVMGITDSLIEFDKLKKRFARIIVLINYSDDVYDKYIEILSRFYNIIGQDSLRKEIFDIADDEKFEEEEKKRMIKKLLTEEEKIFYQSSEDLYD